MFKCYFCEQITPPKTTRHSVVIELREKRYSTRRRETKRTGGGGGGRGGFRSREEPVQDRGGKGQEISKEVPACPACAAKHHEAKVIAAEVVMPTDAATETNLDAATEATTDAVTETADKETNSSEQE
ncbi:hypothetical protein [Planctomycetes bacterium K23_9]|uniref:Uncharacterized protein n=1 Tax=Stieleria marina TaxID=1930275 RepID=A0A517P0Y0_9BACT|nr:hypothetical protein K239x_50540 [Planctomycetes bacterium K23_9]